MNNLIKFNTVNLMELLINKDNILPLECLLDTEGQQLQRLQRLEKEKKLDFGPKIKKRNLSHLFSNVKNEVDSFLGITGIDTPKYHYFNLLRPNAGATVILFTYLAGTSLFLAGVYGLTKGQIYLPPLNMLAGFCFKIIGDSFYKHISRFRYDDEFESITLKKEKYAKFIPTFAHEYVHHIQKKLGLTGKLELILQDSFSVFKEGHARGVERNIANSYRKKEDNEAFLYDITNRTFGELKSTYLWMCKHLDIPSQKSLLKTKTSRDEEENWNRFRSNRPTNHAMGNTLFSLYETQFGDEIYKKVLNGEPLSKLF